MNSIRTRLGTRLVCATSLTSCVLLLHAPGAFAADKTSWGLAAPLSTAARTAADLPVAGRVTQTNGEPLPGVTVLVKGTSIGTSTGVDGSFSLQVPEGSTLVFSFLGFVKQEVTINGAQSSLTIKLLDDAQQLNDVVVVGYGEQKKETVTGAISTLNAKAFESRITPNPVAALQGTVAGLVVTRTSGNPGNEGWDFQIRGASSQNGSTPLIVVDGVPYTDNGALGGLNSQDIESISVLKDASAAIYGARAAGGVVLVTTKRGKTGKPKVRYSGIYGVKSMGLNRTLTNPRQWYEMYNQGQVNNGNPNHPSKIYEPYYLGFDDPNVSKVLPAGFGGVSPTNDITFFDNNWLDVLWGNARSQTHTVSLEGRSDKMGYYASFGYTNDSGMLQWGENYNRKFNARFNSDYQVSKHLKIENQLWAERQKRVEPSGLSEALKDQAQPGFAVSTQGGQPYGWGGNWTSPPWVAELGGNREELYTRINDNLRAIYSFNDNLRATAFGIVRTDLGNIETWQNKINFYSYDDTRIQATWPTSADNVNSYEREDRRNNYYSYGGQLDYNATFAENHAVTAMAGGSFETLSYDRFSAKRRNLPPGLHSLNLGEPVPGNGSSNGDAYAWAIGSYYGRLTYSFKNKYLVEALARYDGTSRFIPSRRWKGFYGVSGGWRLTEENFMKSLTAVNELKLKASYGEVGNQNGIGNYDAITAINTGGGYPFGTTLANNQSNRPGSLASPERTWERVANTNFGVEFALLRSRLFGSFDYYIKKNDNMLIRVTYPTTLGSTAPLTNNGTLQTKGWDAQLGWRDKVGEFSYFVTAILFDNTNKLVQLAGLDAYNVGSVTGAREGYALNSYFGYVSDGLIQNDAELRAYKFKDDGTTLRGGVIPSKIGVGDRRYKDVNGDGILDVKDAVYLGNTNPRYSYSLTVGGSWKGIDLSVLVQGVGQRDTYRQGNSRGPVTFFQNFNSYYYGKTWTPDNTDALYPRLMADGGVNSYNYTSSDFAVQNGGYARLKNVVLGYTLPATLTGKVGLGNCRIYYTGENLTEWVNIKDGWDPEKADSPDGYPSYRYSSIGVDISF